MWEPVDTRFLHKRHAVGIVALGAVGNDPVMARALLENLGAVVLLHLPGTPKDFLKVLRQGPDAAPYLIVCAHGDDNGIVFGDYAPGIDTSMLREGRMPPERVAQNINLPGCVVINDACFGGEEAMAKAFMSGGLKAYVGTVAPIPHFTASPLFLAHFFYALFRDGRSERDAWEHAASYDADSRLFVYYDEEGCHRVS